MFLNKDRLAIVHFSEKGLSFFLHSSQQTLPLSFPETVFNDLEIKDNNQFVNILEPFLKQNKILDLNIIMLLSPELCLSHRFTTNNSQLNHDISMFVESVPFEKVASLNLTDTNKQSEVLTLATNQELLTTVAEILGKHNNSLLYVVSQQALNILGLPENKISFDQSIIEFVFDVYPQLKNYSFPLETRIVQPIAAATKIDPNPAQPKTNQSRMILLVSIFVILLLVLGLVVASKGFF